MARKASQATERLIRAAWAVRAGSSMHFVIPIWVAFGVEELGLTVFETSLLFGIWIASIAVFEIPAGAVADRFGRKRMFVIGSFLVALGSSAFVFGLSLPFLVLGNATYGLGVASSSGTIEPIVYQAMRRDFPEGQHPGFKNAYDRYLSQDGFILFSFRTLSFALAGVLYTVSPILPFVAVVVTRVVSAVIAQLFVADLGVESKFESTTTHLIQTVRLLRASRVVLIGFGLYLGFGLVMEQYWVGYQPFFFDAGITEAQVGFVFAGISVTSAIGSVSASFFMARVKSITVLFVRYVALIVLGISFVLPFVSLQIAAAVVAGLASGVGLIALTSIVQNNVEERYHSAAVSFVGFTETFVFLVGILAAGVQVDLFGVATASRALGLLALAATLFGYFMWRRYQTLNVNLSS